MVELIAGILGRLIMPGRDPGGFLLTIVIGMIGALVGGLIVQLLGGTGLTGFSIWSILVATLGAIILLAIYLPAVRRLATDLNPCVVYGTAMIGASMGGRDR